MAVKKGKWVSAQEAIHAIKAGQRVLVGEACGEPQTLVEALLENKEYLKGIEVVPGSLVGGRPYLQAGLEEFFHFLTFHVTPDTTHGVGEGWIDYIPIRREEVPTLFQPGGTMPLDVALIQVTPPDERGYCSLGVVAGHTLAGALNARTVIAEVNEQMPWTHGDTIIPLAKLDYLVKSSRPVLTFADPPVGEEEKRIGQYVAELVPDGATLELGIGALPVAVLSSLNGKRELGIHSGMITDSVLDLIERGVITNARKSIDRGKTVTGLLMGSERLYRYAHRNPNVEVKPVDYTHAIKTLAQIDNFMALNSEVEVDLTGQVNAESLGKRQISGVGGQADFIRGAALSKGGKSIITMNSTARNGEISRIVPFIGNGAYVTTPRFDNHYVVTEFGIAELRGKTLTQRAEALIKIAHPKFQEELRRSYAASFRK